MKYFCFISSFLCMILFSGICLANSNDVVLYREIDQEEFLILPKIKLKTNKCLVAITIDNQLNEPISVEIEPRFPKVSEVKNKIDRVSIEANDYKTINYTIKFKEPYFGHIANERIKFFSKSGKTIRFKQTKFLSINIQKRNLPFRLTAYAIIVQAIFIIPFVYLVILLVSKKISMNLETIEKCSLIFIALAILIFLIYDIYKIYII